VYIAKSNELKVQDGVMLLLLLLFFIRLHRSTTYVDATYCYRPSSMVCQLVSRSVTLVSPAETAKPVEMLFGLRTLIGQISRGQGQFEEERVKYSDSLP